MKHRQWCDHVTMLAAPGTWALAPGHWSPGVSTRQCLHNNQFNCTLASDNNYNLYQLSTIVMLNLNKSSSVKSSRLSSFNDFQVNPLSLLKPYTESVSSVKIKKYFKTFLKIFDRTPMTIFCCWTVCWILMRAEVWEGTVTIIWRISGRETCWTS